MAGAVKFVSFTLTRNLRAIGGIPLPLPVKGVLPEGCLISTATSIKRTMSAAVQTQSTNFSLFSAVTKGFYKGIRIRPASDSAAVAKAMAKAARPLVICGPSGVGKTTLIERLIEAFPDSFGFSVSHTTRKRREGELDGVNYHYVKRIDFESARERGEFIETAQFSGNMYGTSRGAVNSVQRSGRICILDIDMQGVIQLKNVAELDPRYVFIRPPSIEDLERRLKNRNSETDESIQARLDIAREEMVYGADPLNFDFVITNDDVEKASKELVDFMASPVEEVRRHMNELMEKK